MKEDLRILRKRKNWKRLMVFELNSSALKLTTLFFSFLILWWQVSAVAAKKNKCFGTFDRLKLLDRSSEMFGKDLEVTNLLKKIRDSYDIAKI